MHKYLNLSKGFYRGTGDDEIKFETFNFSGGEVHIKIDHNGSFDEVTINCRLNSSDDLIRLCLAVDALREMGVKWIIAFIPYIPYARQDRRMVRGEPLSIKVFANIINSLNLDGVICIDAHSDVSLALINNISHQRGHTFVASFIHDNLLNEQFEIISPDAGASKRIFELCQNIGHKNPPIMCNKHRDTATGKITSIEVGGEVSGKNCLIVDDICDGGGTFLELGKALKEKGANDLYLFVTHGIFSKGVNELLNYFKLIGTTNSVKEIYPAAVHVINL